MSDSLLLTIGLRVLAVETGLALALMLVVMLAASAGEWWRRRRFRQLTSARDVVARLLTSETPSRADEVTLRALPLGVQEALVLEFGRAVRGDSVHRLSALGRTLGITRRAAAYCGSRFWWRRLQGARLLGALDHDCPELRERLHDAHPTVRVEVLHWAAGRADGQVIEALVARLVDPERLCRFTVRDSLLRVGQPAARALARFLDREDSVALADALLVARGLAQPELVTPAIRLTRHPEAMVRARAVAVLGALGGDAAATVLLERLCDDDAAVREASARAIGEIGHWGGASALAERLGDTSFPVRRESALSLRRLGSVGLLVLRRAKQSSNPFAVDMATQVLDLPDSVFHRVAA
jgi:hypothetical protein